MLCLLKMAGSLLVAGSWLVAWLPTSAEEDVMAQHAERPIDVDVSSRALHGKAGRAGPGQA